MLLYLLVSAGCEVTDVPEGMAAAVYFQAEKDSYVIGDTVEAMLKNGSEQPVHYNLCDVQLEYKNAGEWDVAGPSMVCQYGLQTLDPGNMEPYYLVLDDPLKLSKGTYRLKTSVEIEGKQTLTTQPFEVHVTDQ